MGVDDLPAKPGLTAVELFQAAADGEVKALWIACTNPVQSMPDGATVRRALERAEFVVAGGLRHHRHLRRRRPAAAGDHPGENNGTVTDSERRISRIARRCRLSASARRLGIGSTSRAASRPACGRAARACSPTRRRERLERRPRDDGGRDLDITGLDWAAIQAAPAQWP